MMVGGGNDVALAATRAGVGRRDESRRGVEEGAMTAAGMSLRGGGADNAKRRVATEDDDDRWDLFPPSARCQRMWQCRCPQPSDQ